MDERCPVANALYGTAFHTVIITPIQGRCTRRLVYHEGE